MRKCKDESGRQQSDFISGGASVQEARRQEMQDEDSFRVSLPRRSK